MFISESMQQIDSPQNPSIKHLLQLRVKSRVRKKEGLFTIEGLREVELALKGGYKLMEIFFCPEFCPDKNLLSFAEIPKTAVSQNVYSKIAYRGSTQGIIAVAKAKDLSLEKLKFKSAKPLVLVVESPEKPGNLGALLRTADAANVDAVLVADPKMDLYNPNIVRSSVGGLFTNQIAMGSSQEIIRFLKEKNIAIFSAILQESKAYTEMNYRKASAIVVGPESTGLSEIWRKESTQNIHIPMSGEADSMNVSVAAGILIFEAKRQRMGIG
jgi:TrmH family RNA methyltransferase